MWTALVYFAVIAFAICAESIEHRWIAIGVFFVFGSIHYKGYCSFSMPILSFTASRDLFALENEDNNSRKKKKKKQKTEKTSQSKTKRKKRKRKKSLPQTEKPNLTTKEEKLPKADISGEKNKPLSTSNMDAKIEPTPNEVVKENFEGFTTVSRKSRRRKKKNGATVKTIEAATSEEEVESKEEKQLVKLQEIQTESTENSGSFTNEELSLPPPEQIEAIKAEKNAEIASLEAQVKALRARSGIENENGVLVSSSSSAAVSVDQSDTMDLIQDDYVYVQSPGAHSTQGDDNSNSENEWSTVGKNGKAKVSRKIFHCGSDQPAFKTFDQNHVKFDEKEVTTMYGEGKAIEQSLPSPKRIELEFAIPALTKEENENPREVSYESVKVTSLSNKSKKEIKDWKVRKPKRKRHKLFWGEICNLLKIKSYDIVSASALYNACFLHAIHKRELKLREIRGIFQSALHILQRDPSKFISSRWTEEKVLGLVSELQNWLDAKPRVDLPKSLWSPEPLKRAVANAVGQAIVIVDLFQIKSTDKPLSVNDHVNLERFDPDGSMHTINDRNMRELLNRNQTCFIYFPSDKLKHWFFFQFS